MSQPNPPAGHGHGDNPLTHMLVSLTGASDPHHESGPPGADPTSVKAGHEPDRFAIRSILYVPVAVVIVLILAYILVTWVFNIAMARKAEDDLRARKDNKEITDQIERPWNERVSRTSTNRPQPLKDANGKIIDNTGIAHPQREGVYPARSDGPDDSTFHRSKLPDQSSNYVRDVRPEDLRPEKYISTYADPVTGQKILNQYGYVDSSKRLVRMPINDAIKMVVHQKQLPIRKDPVKPQDTTMDRAKLSNAGRGGPSNPPSAAPAPTPTKPAGH